jgi:hypothetical protein
MTTKFKVKFDGKNLVPLEPVDWPGDTEAEIELSRPRKAA